MPEHFGTSFVPILVDKLTIRPQVSCTGADISSQSTPYQKEAVSVESLAEKYSFFGRVVESVKSIIATIGAFYTLEKTVEGMKEVVKEGDKIAKFSIELSTAFGSLKNGEEAFAKINEIAEKVPLSFDDVTRATLRAKKEGLDPFNGTLEALIDTNAKYGGSVDTLNTLIDALGKAYARGSLNAKTLVSLQEQGVPAAKLLGSALGKTADEIEDMAKKGELGRESIRLLIDQLGQSAKGAANQQLGLVSSLVTKISDKWNEFLELVAKSGAYDYARDKLQQINDAFARGIGDGSLKEKAQSLSNAIVAIGNAVSGTFRFIVDHSTAILAAAHAYGVLKLSMLSLDLVGVATKFIGLSGAVKETAVVAKVAAAEVSGLSVAVKDAAVVSEVAAAEGGVFARLGAKIKAIPKAVQIAIVVAAADFAVTQIENVLEVSKQLQEVNKQNNDFQKEANALSEKLSIKAAALAKALKGFADAQIASADELATKDKRRSEQYIDSLKNAFLYYEALKVQAQSLSDYKGVEAATGRLKELGTALAAANTHFKEINESLAVTSETVGLATEKYDALKRSGETAATSIEGAFKKIEINTPQGLKDTLALIGSISSRSHEAKEAVQTELVSALAKLDETDLRKFQQNVTDQLKTAKGNAEALKTAIGAALQTELLSLGLTAQQAGVQFSAGGQKIIDTFSNIASNARASAQQIQLAFASALSKATTEGEVQALEKQLQQAFAAGKIGADQFGVAMEAAGRKTAAIVVAATTAGASLDGMGRAGESAAQRISGALQDTRDKLVIQADQIARALSNAIQSGASPETVAALRARFKAVDGELGGLNAQIATVQKSLDGLNETLTGDHGGGVNITKIWNEAQEAIRKANVQLFNVSSLAGKSASDIEDIGKAAGASGIEISAMKDQIEGVSRALEQADRDARHLDDTVRLGLQGVSELGAALYKSFDAATFARANSQIADAKNNVIDLTQAYTALGNGTSDAFIKQFGSLDAAQQRIDDLKRSLQAGTSELSILDSQSLSGLQSALDAAASKANTLANASKQAADQLASLNAQLQDQIDQNNNDQVSIENRRFQTQEDKIKQLAQQGGDAAQAQADQALALAQKVHDDAMKKIAEQLAAQTQSSNQQAQQRQQKQQAAAPSPTPTNTAVAATLNLVVTGAPGSLNSIPDSELQQFAYRLTPLAMPIILDELHRQQMVAGH